jgi:hypothetical protein
MIPRRPRLALAALMAVGTLVIFSRAPLQAHAAACGDDSSPPCPAAQTVIPDVVNVPIQDATVEVRGTGLTLVDSARLQPGGAALTILGRSDSALTLGLPDRLAPGSYQVALVIPGQTQGFSMTPFFQVADGSAQRSLPQFTFAPAAPVAPASAGATTAVPPLFSPTPAASTSFGSIVRLLLVVLATGAIGGGLVTVVYTVVHRWRTVRLRDLTYAAMERHLAALWTSDEQRVEAPYAARAGSGTRAPTPGRPEAFHEREPSPPARY